jgi:hypothetical protein
VHDKESARTVLQKERKKTGGAKPTAGQRSAVGVPAVIARGTAEYRVI